MKALIIGSDLILDENGDVKLIEMNTSSGVFDTMLSELNFSSLVDLAVDNSINEVHFIYNTESNVFDRSVQFFDNDGNPKSVLMHDTLQELFEAAGMTFIKHSVNQNSITVPFIEDASNKLILRQAYDGTALIDETYCADKKGLQDLIRNEDYAIPTYLNDGEISIDTLSTLKSTSPNVVRKYRFPSYDSKVFPELHTLDTEEDLTTLKSSLNNEYYLQEFINSSNNLSEGRYSTIRSIDVVYGSNLDILHLGSYTSTSPVDNDIWENEFIENTKILNMKSRVKWISKRTTDLLDVDFHADDNSKLLKYDGTLVLIDDVQIGDQMKSIDFSNFPETERNYLPNLTSTLLEMSDTLVINSANVIQKKSETIDSLFITVQLEDGSSWLDYPTSYTYVEEKDSTVTRFKVVNDFVIGDKVITINHNDGTLIKKEIIGLIVSFEENKNIFQINVEEQDIFLPMLDETNNISLIQHNVGCCDWCDGNPAYNCGTYCCAYDCSQCGGGCFIDETKINTPSGVVRIDEIKVGDEVVSYDFENGHNIVGIVGGLFEKDYNDNLLIINNHKTNATIGHTFAVKDLNGDVKWAAYDPSADAEYHVDLEVISLTEKEHKIYLNNEWVLIDKIELEPYTGKVYNISVDHVKNYFAENVLVHNIALKKI
jgi:hypothetical protein